MNHWLFQANPKFYDFKADLENLKTDGRSQWNASKYWDEMEPGDPVAIWVSGPEGGLMALGELASNVYTAPDFMNPSIPGHWVEWELLEVIDPPVTRRQMERNPVLSQMQPIAPVHVGTNFRVTEEQWKAMLDLIERERDDSWESGFATALRSLSENLKELSARTFIPVESWNEIEYLIDQKLQIILEGPPGSGKTYIARLFARYLAGVALDDDITDRVEIVQFHQSYGYEDFVAGIRPVTSDSGQLTYRSQPGIFLDMCARAKARTDETFVLIIDEINRGNLSRIFGELLYGLEYRDQAVRLQTPVELDGAVVEHLRIPENLYLIGTMNSTDRSLAMIDYALRRRFYFWRLMPTEAGQAPVLRRWLDAQADLSPTQRARHHDAFVALNAEIARDLGEDYQIGHSYLMLADGELTDPAALERVWWHAIEPLLREYFHTRANAGTTIEQLRIGFFGAPVPLAEPGESIDLDA